MRILKLAALAVLAPMAVQAGTLPTPSVGTPTQPAHATSKAYVDSLGATLIPRSLLGQPNGPAQLDGTGALDSQNITNSSVSAAAIDFTSVINQVATNGTTPLPDSVRYAWVIDVRDEGAICNGTVDDTAALQRAFTLATNATMRPHGALIQLPSGTCKISAALSATLPLTANIAIRGWGKGVSFINQTATADGIDLTLNSTGSTAILQGNLDLRDFSVTSTQVPVNGGTVTAGIKITDTSTHNGDGESYTAIDNVQIGSSNLTTGRFYNGIDIEQLSNVTMRHVKMTTSPLLAAPTVGSGLVINGGNTTSLIKTSYNLEDISVSGTYVAGIAFGGYLQGIWIYNPVLVSPIDGIDYLAPATNVGTLNVVGGIINTHDFGIQTNSVRAVNISGGSQIFSLGAPLVQATFQAVSVLNTSSSSISGVQVIRGTAASAGIMLTDNGTGGDTIFGNTIHGQTGIGISAHTLTPGANSIAITGNVVTATVTPLSIINSDSIVQSGNCFSTGESCNGIPAITGCGASGVSLATGSNDQRGTITEGTAATGCVITWAAPKIAAPMCTVTSPTGATLTSYAATTTALTLVNPSATGSQFTYSCGGQ